MYTYAFFDLIGPFRSGTHWGIWPFEAGYPKQNKINLFQQEIIHPTYLGAGMTAEDSATLVTSPRVGRRDDRSVMSLGLFLGRSPDRSGLAAAADRSSLGLAALVAISGVLKVPARQNEI